MKTEVTKSYRSFQDLGRREIVAYFSGGIIKSNGSSLLLREVEKRTAGNSHDSDKIHLTY